MLQLPRFLCMMLLLTSVLACKDQPEIGRKFVNPRMVSAGWDNTCVIDDNGVHCWGANDYGQSNVPEGLVNPVFVETGRYNTCAIDDNGVVCWGQSDLGLNDVPNTLSHPYDVAIVSYLGVCALDDVGIHCWGNFAGSGGPLLGGQLLPDEPLIAPTEISGGDRLCALDQRHIVCSEHYIPYYDLETAILAPDNTVDPRGLSSSDGINACVIDDGELVCWGHQEYGLLQPPLRESSPLHVSLGVLRACALDSLGLYCWGLNDYGQSNAPANTILTNPTYVDAGWRHTCAINGDRVICWGDNSAGQL